jgi:hypothetical protein
MQVSPLLVQGFNPTHILLPISFLHPSPILIFPKIHDPDPDDCPLKLVPFILQHFFLILSDVRCWPNPAQSTAPIREWHEAQFEQVSPKPGTRNTECMGWQWQAEKIHDLSYIIYCTNYSYPTRRSVLGEYAQLLTSTQAGIITYSMAFSC